MSLVIKVNTRKYSLYFHFHSSDLTLLSPGLCAGAADRSHWDTADPGGTGR